MRDPFGTGVVLALIFMILLLPITIVSAGDNCMGYCSGMYMCGWDYCFCPGAAYESSCHPPCIFSPSDCDSGGHDDDFKRNSNGSSDGLNTGAIVGIVVAVILVVIAAMAGVIAYMKVSRSKTSPNHHDSKQTAALAGTTTSPAGEV